MDPQKLLESVNQNPLPFVYSGERLHEEKCKKALAKIAVDTGAIVVITNDDLLGDCN